MVAVFAASLLKPVAIARRRGAVLGAGVGVSQFLQQACETGGRILAAPDRSP